MPVTTVNAFTATTPDDAVANCANSGLNLLTAWFDGTNIVYKESPNSNVYKSSGTTAITPIKTGHFAAWPSPVKDVLHLNDAFGAEYMVTDMTGKAIMRGKVPQSGQISLDRLTNGVYSVRLSDTAKGTHSINILKQ